MHRRSLEARASPSSKSTALPVSPAVLTDDLDGPLCALSLYLSVAERVSREPEIDRDKLGQALQGAREQLADLVLKTEAACQSRR
jgi:hypothetical protein